MMATVQRYTDPAAFDQLRAEWSALESRISPRTPFAGPLWHETWWETLRRKTWHTRDELALYTVRDMNGQLIGVAPYMQTKRPGVGPVRLIELQALGADPHITELRGVVCASDNHAVVLQALKDAFDTSSPRARWTTWHNVRWCEGEQWRPPSVLASGSRIWARPQPAYVVDIPDSWGAFEARLTKRVRKKIRHCTNLLNRDGKQVTLRVVAELDAVKRAVHTFYDLVAVRAEVRHANPFERADVRAFFEDYAVRSATQGELRIFELCCGEEVVASRIGFALGKELYLYHSGNLPSWDHYSIMTTLLTEIFRWAIKSGFSLVNLSTGLDRSKARWRPREIMYVDAIEIRPGAINAALYKANVRIRGGKDAPADATFQFLDGQIGLPNYDQATEAQDNS